MPATALLGELRRVDRTLLLPGAATRAALGVALVLGAGLATGSASVAIAAAAGAFSVGIASIQGAYRSRVHATVATSIAMGVSTLVGALAVRDSVLAVVVTGLWAFVAGIATALGPAGTVVGLQAVVALLIAGDFALSAREAVTRALLVLAGGLVQTVLVVAVWPLRSYAAERRALALVFAELASYAREMADRTRTDPALPPDPAALSAAAVVLGDPNPLGRDASQAGFRALLDLAGRIRLELAALAHAEERAATRVRPEQVAGIGAVLLEAADVLGGMARELAPWASGRPVAGRSSAGATEAVDLVGLRPSVVDAVQALRGQLRSAQRVSSGLATSNGPDLSRAAQPSGMFAVESLHAVPALTDALLTLRAAFDVRSETFRHAVRLSAVVLVAAALFRVLSLPHGYWVAVTALVVLRPDYASTRARGVARVAGTAAGALLATVVAAELRPSSVVLVALIAVCAFGAYLLFRSNQAAFSLFLTGYVVFLLALAGLPGRTTGLDRLLDTAIGGALALVAYRLWPTWEHGQVPDRLAELVDAQVAYACAVLQAYAVPAARRGALTAETQGGARRARAAAEASVARAGNEPLPQRGRAASTLLDPSVAEGVIAAGQRNAQAILSLHARMPDVDAEALPEAYEFGAALQEAAAVIARALREGGSVSDYPRLRRRQLDLAERLGNTSIPRRLLALETDVMVDALDTMAHLLQQNQRVGRNGDEVSQTGDGSPAP